MISGSSVVDLASDMIRLAGLEPGHDIEICFSGVRPGEKLYEEVFNGEEEQCLSIHPKVREAYQKLLDPERLQVSLDLLKGAMDSRVISRRQIFLRTFLKLIPGYAPPKDGLGKYAMHEEEDFA